jgi:hypothetical protein
MPATRRKAAISERALFARVNRKLAKEFQSIRRCRADTRAWPSLGDLFLVDFRDNAVLGHDIDLEGFARELGVMEPWEELAAD